jgi:hypothetical protein
MLAIVAALSVVYVRRMLQVVRAREPPPPALGWDALGVVLFAVARLPVFWMISTALKTDEQINSFNPTGSRASDAAHFTDAIHRPYFWTDVKNSVIVVLVTVALRSCSRSSPRSRSRSTASPGASSSSCS